MTIQEEIKVRPELLEDQSQPLKSIYVEGWFVYVMAVKLLYRETNQSRLRVVNLFTLCKGISIPFFFSFTVNE